MDEQLPLREVKDRLSEIVDEVERTQQVVTITRHGHPVAAIISLSDLEGMRETIDILSTPGLLDKIRMGEAALARGEYATADDLRGDLAARRQPRRV
jgi:prevent-host-death family protein